MASVAMVQMLPTGLDIAVDPKRIGTLGGTESTDLEPSESQAIATIALSEAEGTAIRQCPLKSLCQ